MKLERKWDDTLLGGEDCHLKMRSGFLVSFRGVNQGFWYHLWHPGQNATVLAAKISFRLHSDK